MLIIYSRNRTLKQNRRTKMDLALTVFIANLLSFVVLATAASQEAANCIRETSLQRYGFNAALQAVAVDVGTCIGIDDEDSELRNGTAVTPAPCQPKCAPNQYALREYANRTGSFRVEAISTCAESTRHCSSCERRSQNTTVFPGSPYEKIVDRGACDGTCEETRESCVVVRSRGVSLEDANGAFIVNTIEQCGCMDSRCYRKDEFLSYWEEAPAENGTEVLLREKIINVGRCVGNCEGILLPERCYPSPSLCRLRIPGGQSSCVPASHTVHSFTGLGGVPVSVVAVITCSCMAA